MPSNLIDLQAERWQNLGNEASSDAKWLADHQERDIRRKEVKRCGFFSNEDIAKEAENIMF